MAGMLQRMREKFQGQLIVKDICGKVFKDYADDELMALSDLQVAVLRVYNSLNKDLLGPHKEPPSKSTIEETKKVLTKKMESFSSKRKEKIDEAEFCNLVLEWTKTDRLIYMTHKVILALLAAPSLALVTKHAGKRAPRIGPVVEKIPAPVFFSVYSVGLVLAQR